MKLWKKNLILLFFVIMIAVVPLLVVKSGKFGGSDGQAEAVIAQISPNYKPWAHSLFEPACAEIESLLFALQAAIGGGIIGFGFGRLSVKRKESAEDDRDR